jgi:hypothetical protein
VNGACLSPLITDSVRTITTLVGNVEDLGTSEPAPSAHRNEPHIMHACISTPLALGVPLGRTPKSCSTAPGANVSARAHPFTNLTTVGARPVAIAYPGIMSNSNYRASQALSRLNRPIGSQLGILASPSVPPAFSSQARPSVHSEYRYMTSEHSL